MDAWPSGTLCSTHLVKNQNIAHNAGTSKAVEKNTRIYGIIIILRIGLSMHDRIKKQSNFT